MGEYDSSVALAKRLIKKKGQPVTLKTFANTPPADPDPPWKSGDNVPTLQTVNAVFLDYEQKYIDGEFIRSGDQRVFAPSTDTAEVPISPTLNGLILRGSQIWKIVGIKPLNPNGQSILFEIQVRQ